MFSRSALLGVCLGLLLLGGVSSVWNWAKAGPPRLEAPSLPLHLGRGKPGQVLDGSIRLRNTGGQPLAFTVQTSCGCTDVRPRAGTLAPRDALDVHLGVRLDTAGSERDVLVTIVSNDPARPSVNVMLRAECPAPIKVSPARADFGSVARSTTTSLALEAFDDQDRPFGPSSGLEAATADDWYDLKLAPGEGPAMTWQVVLKEGLPVGTHTGRSVCACRTVTGSRSRSASRSSARSAWRPRHSPSGYRPRPRESSPKGPSSSGDRMAGRSGSWKEPRRRRVSRPANWASRKRSAVAFRSRSRKGPSRVSMSSRYDFRSVPNRPSFVWSSLHPFPERRRTRSYFRSTSSLCCGAPP